MKSKIEEGAVEPQTVDVEPQTVDQARDAVERSRERISRTLDRLEDRIVEKKQELQDKADVLRPVKNQVQLRPLTAVAVAVGVGALLGSFGGGIAKARNRGRRTSWQASDDELEPLRALASGSERNRGRRNGRGQSRLDGLKGQLIRAAATAITAAITKSVKEYARGSGGRGGSGEGSRR
jgi:ElaB/YqjD/DUF883 family membrane-anchored ribosome-binding protein